MEFTARPVPCLRTEQGLRALSGISPIDPEHVRRYLRAKFKAHLALVEEKLAALAATFAPEALAQRAMDIYMQLRPQVPAGKAGWGRAGIRALQAGRISVVPGWASKASVVFMWATPRWLHQAFFSRAMNA